MDQVRHHQRQTLADLAEQAMRDRGLDPDFPAEVLRQVADIEGPAKGSGPDIADLSAMAWCSIDNDDSRDLDQLTVLEPLPGGAARLHVAVADVDALVPKDSPADRYAADNTTSVYTAARIFPMLPERLSTDLTSLNPGEARPAMVTSIDFDADGIAGQQVIRRARVHSKAKLAYDSVTAWLSARVPSPLRPPPCPASTRSCATRTRSPSACASGAVRSARWSSRPSSPRRSSRATMS